MRLSLKKGAACAPCDYCGSPVYYDKMIFGKIYAIRRTIFCPRCENLDEDFGPVEAETPEEIARAKEERRKLGLDYDDDDIPF